MTIDNFLTGLRNKRFSILGGLTGEVPRTITTKLTESKTTSDFGTVSDGSTDNAAAIRAATDYIYSSRTSSFAAATTFPNKSTTTIRIPAGKYAVTDTLVSNLQADGSNKTAGLHIIGDGAGSTQIQFTPTTDKWLIELSYAYSFVRISGIQFVAQTSGGTAHASFMTSTGDFGTNVGVIFDQCVWTGDWKNGISLLGADNNSEWTFIHCRWGSTTFDTACPAFFSIPSGGSDQFVNYMFYGCTYNSSDATPWVDVVKGGSLGFYGCTSNAFGSAYFGTTRKYLINTHGYSHSPGTCHLTIDHMRFEMPNPYLGLLYLEWTPGTVSIRNLSTSVPALGRYPDRLMHFQNQGVMGTTQRNPLVIVDSSEINGNIRIEYGASDYECRNVFNFRSCEFMNWTVGGVQKTDPAQFFDFVATTGTVHGGVSEVNIDDTCRIVNLSGSVAPSGVSVKNITSCVANNSGLIQVTTSAAHGFGTGWSVTIASVVGTTEANATWVITVISSTTFNLRASTFTNAYVSGGTATAVAGMGTDAIGLTSNGVRTITGAANNGSGLIRITCASHGYATGFSVVISGVTGTTEANGTWTITWISSSTFDLQASTFANAYVSGGSAIAVNHIIEPRRMATGGGITAHPGCIAASTTRTASMARLKPYSIQMADSNGQVRVTDNSDAILSRGVMHMWFPLGASLQSLLISIPAAATASTGTLTFDLRDDNDLTLAAFSIANVALAFDEVAEFVPPINLSTTNKRRLRLYKTGGTASGRVVFSPARCVLTYLG